MGKLVGIQVVDLSQFLPESMLTSWWPIGAQVENERGAAPGDHLNMAMLDALTPWCAYIAEEEDFLPVPGLCAHSGARPSPLAPGRRGAPSWSTNVAYLPVLDFQEALAQPQVRAWGQWMPQEAQPASALRFAEQSALVSADAP